MVWRQAFKAPELCDDPSTTDRLTLVSRFVQLPSFAGIFLKGGYDV